MAWELNGNADATATSFLGPTNTQPLIVKTTPPTPGATPQERLRVTTEGRVGIGILNPSAKLTVAGGGAIINNVAIGTDGLSVDYPNEQETIGLANPGTSALLRLQSPNGLAFHTGPPGTAATDNLRMTITSSGEVGVGKAPAANYKLEVAGILNATDIHKNGSALVSSQWTDVTDGINYAGGNVGIGTTDLRHGHLTIEDAAVPLVLKETNQAPNAGGLWRLALDGGLMRFDANTAAGGDFSSFATPLAMSPSGNVGIATTPGAGAKLTVAGGVVVKSDSGTGVDGRSTSLTGVDGRSDNFVGVRATCTNKEHGFGVFASGRTAGLFAGSVNVFGDLTVFNGNKSFKIDHPLDPQNKYLSHNAVEAPERKNVYDGGARLDEDGAAWVELPEWFEALNGDVRYQLTPVGGSAPNLHVAEEVSENRFKIAGGEGGMKVCWQLTGSRKDPWAAANPFEVEQEKPQEERGRFLEPSLYDAPEEQRVMIGAIPEAVEEEHRRLIDELRRQEEEEQRPELEELRRRMEEQQEEPPPEST